MCANQIDLNLPKGRKAQHRNMFFKSAPCKPVFPIYLLFSLSSLGFPRRWLQTDAGKFNLSIWDGPPDRPSLRERWGRRGQAAAAISESFLPGISELTSWKLSHPDEDVCTRWEHPKNSGRIIRHLNTIEVYQISLWHNTNTFKTSHKLFSWYKHCTHTHTHNISLLQSFLSCNHKSFGHHCFVLFLHLSFRLFSLLLVLFWGQSVYSHTAGQHLLQYNSFLSWNVSGRPVFNNKLPQNKSFIVMAELPVTQQTL